MDLSSSFRNSFKSHGSYKKQHSRKISAGGSGNDDIYHEERPILSDHTDDHAMRTTDDDLADRGEVIVKIDGGGGGGGGTPNSGGNKIWRESSYDFWKDDEFRQPREEAAVEDPPSRLIDQFLRKQKAVGAEMSLDVDLEMDELRHENSLNLLPVAETLVPIRNNNSDNNQRVSTSKEVKVSFQETTSSAEKRNRERRREEESVILSESSDDEDDDDMEDRHSQPQQFHNRRRSSSTAVDNNGGGGEVLKCTSFQRRQKSILRTKTKSRLIDQPEIPDRRPEKGKSGQMKSGMVGKLSGILEDEEDDPFDDDIPEELKRANLNALTMIQWISLVLIVTFLVATISVSDWKREKIWGLECWKWEVLILVLICGRLVSGWGIRIAVFFIERNFLLRKRVLYFVYGVRKAVQNCIWLGLVLIAWHYMFDKKVEDETDSNKFLQLVNKILLCLLVGTLLWLVKTLMVKVLASSFHVSTFFDRIQESLFNQYVIETLSGPPFALHNLDEDERAMAEIQKLQNAGVNVPAELRETVLSPTGKSGRGVIGSGAIPKTTARGGSMKYSGTYSKKLDEGIPIDYLHKWNHKNISAWNMKRLMKMVRHGLLATLDEQILDSSYDNESNNQIRSEFEAKVAARKIFRNVARGCSKYIYLEDLMRFMKEDEALKTLNLLGGSSRSEKISKSALKSWVVNAFRERRALALTLDDTKTAVNTLHHMVNVLVGVIIVIISLIILEIATSKMLVFVSSQVVVVAFVFGNTCKTIFEAVVFLFVMHPYDVGDRCEIDGVQMIVEEMNILTTIFLRFDNQKIIYPNSTLATKQIGNYYRSPDMGDSVEFYVHIVTPAEKIAIMKQRITSYIESKRDHWYASPSIVFMDFVELNQLKLAVWMRHRMNHQDMGEKWSRRALLVEEMVKIFKELDIEYRLLPRDINIRSMPPVNSTRLPSNWTDRS
ncbi:mechanosensitive ion channel protein 6-like [Cornus florida]|uniref:mechanosensitive ion channel protein 6-like n=1 Tax=Cornus florida TaxID=4283 RepID=UPI002896C2CD|nr:mechanosensitive ion channel protein 6-like [Cornus florida]